METWLIQTLTNITLFFTAFLLSNMLTKGFVFRYLRVWASRGSLLMVKIHTPMDHYFRIGWVEEGFLKFNDKTTRTGVNQKKAKVKAKSLSISMKAVYRCLGVAMVDIDEEKNALILPDMSVVTGYDANKINNIITRALSEPRNQKDQNLIIIAVVISAAALLVGIGVFYNLISMQDTLKVIITSIKDISAGKIIPLLIGFSSAGVKKWLL